MLGNLSLAENSLTSDGADLITLAQETISIRFTAIRPFLPQLLIPGSVSFVLWKGRSFNRSHRWCQDSIRRVPKRGPCSSSAMLNSGWAFISNTSSRPPSLPTSKAWLITWPKT
ncbi:PREDICTED: uncharacterized protein LOC105505149 [Colobus angolensis palliatus]|uniref:uncharacterized protein LOC105505149 n=1 Tax=Colobus angolensis palliatus TaxID=336983 RepID=UPI0005F45C22|nr:PREDICTED: uncharacterized protein LOC105505149 [Colobus angolensis palliatus]